MTDRSIFPRSLFAAVLLVVASCGQSNGESGSAAPQSAAATPASARDSADVARIVFIDQEQACECTRNRITTSWDALQAALGEGSGLEIERIHRDTQADQADAYRLLRPMVTVPGIYLLDAEGAVIELLQGEITEEQFRAALDGSGQAEGARP